MFNISSFLEKFTKQIISSENSTKDIQNIIEKQTGIDCSALPFTIRNAVLYIETSPGIRNKIFMSKQSILEELAHTTPKIIDIR